MPHRIRASVRFLTTAEGGRVTPPQSGVRPQLRLGKVYTTVLIHGASPTQSFDLGVAYDVTLELPFWTEVAHLFRPDDACELYEGNHLVARGTWS